MSRISLPAQPAAATATLIPSSNSSLAGTHLTGRRLLIGRVVWAALMLLFSGSYLLAVLIYAFQLHGFQQGVYTRLTSQNAVVSGYDAIISLYLIQVGPNASLIITLLSPCWFAVSLLIYWCRSDDWMALFVALLLVMLSTNLSPALLAFSVEAGYASPLGIYITLLHLLTWSSIVFFFALFPDGRFVPGWTRWLTLVYLAWQVSLCLPTSAPFSVVHWPPLINAAFYLGIALAFGFAQLYRYLRVSSPLQRQQVKWVMFGMLMGMLVDTANLLPVLVFPVLAQASSFQVLYPILNQVLYPFVFLLIPITFGLAVLRYRLWDIDLIINRTLVYGLLTASIITLYLLVVVGLGELFSGLGNLLLSLCATGLAALGFQPLRQRLQKAVNHLMFGERDEPYQVLARLGNQLEGALATTELLPIIVQTVAQALKLPYVAITYKQQDSDTIAASSGKALDGESFICVPLVTRTELVGELLLGGRGPGDSLTPADLRLLRDLAPQIAVAVQAVRLTAELKQMTSDLQQSRTQLIAAREEERRRLRRDLHDGLGPTLASLTFKIDAARNLLKQNSERADGLLVEVRQQTQETLAQIRRLVYNLRPPALDELGLVSALREQAATYQHQGLQVLIDAPDYITPLPAAVEVAAFHIAQEALINVVRHAVAQRCYLRFSLSDHALALEISDDGKGLAQGHPIGVGLLGMRERATELGGTCIITSGSSGGTTILVTLPLGFSTNSSILQTQVEPTK